MQTLSTDEVDRLLGQAAERHGLTLDELRAQGRRDELTDPELRDLWLIWGDGPSDAPDDR